VLDVDSKVIALRSLQCTAASTLLEASRARGGEIGRLFQLSKPGEQSLLAPASRLEASPAMSLLASPSLPARFASPHPLSNAAESARDCSLHRRVSWSNSAAYAPKTAENLPPVAGSGAAAGDAAVGGRVDVHGDAIDEGCRGLCRGGCGGGRNGCLGQIVG